MLIYLFLICFRLFCMQWILIPVLFFSIYLSLFFLSLSFFSYKLYCTVCVCVHIKFKKEKKRSSWRKINVNENKISLVFFSSIQRHNNNNNSPCVGHVVWAVRGKLFYSLVWVKWIASIHLCCVLSSNFSYPVKLLLDVRGQKNDPTSAFILGARPTTG